MIEPVNIAAAFRWIMVFVVGVLLGPDYASAQTKNAWSLDSVDSQAWSVHGQVKTAPGVSGTSLVFNGETLLKVKDSSGFAGGKEGFTLIAWVNPYHTGGEQQMIAAKNRYSLNERQWSVMIDKDKRFRLYVWQGRWTTANSETVSQLGHWSQVGVVVRPTVAELWINGKRESSVRLNKPIPSTKAPLTLGGIDDNGRIWQNFIGAIDEVRLIDRPLSAAEMAAAYRPVAKTHKIPTFAARMRIATGPIGGAGAEKLWAPSAALPSTVKAEVLAGVEFSVIKRWEPKVDGYKWLHGVALAWHKGKLYASFGHNRGLENTITEEGRYCVSADSGKTWSSIRTIDVGVESKDLAVSHGVFLSHDGQLWSFLGAFHDTRQRVHTRAYTLNEGTGEWRQRGVVLRDGFWPMMAPVEMRDGNWLMPGFIVGKGNPAAVAISAGDDLTKWRGVVIPKASGVGRMWGESATIIEGSRVTNIARYGDRAQALVASSDDFGRTWTASSESNLPMATSKPCAGLLSSGQRYLICSTTSDGGGRRSPLTIALSRRGQKQFSKVFVIRHAVFPSGPGESHANAKLSYPYAVEHAGKLYVAYSNSGPRGGNQNSAELAVIPLEKLRAQ